MSVLSTLRNSITQLTGSRVTWHPLGITAVRRFTIEPCAALPKRILKGVPSSPIKKANPEEACPFTIIPEPTDILVDTVQEGKIPEEDYEFKLIATLEPPSEIDPQALISHKENIIDINPDYFHCHTSTLAYVEYISDMQLLAATNSYDKPELPNKPDLSLTFIEDEEDNLYD